MTDEKALIPIEEPSVIQDSEAAQKALDIMTRGDLGKLSTPERAQFLAMMAKSLGLNPLTKPVDLIPGQGGQGLVIYFNRGATDQLRAKHKVNLEVLERYNPTPSTYAVRIRATLPNGRQDESTGVVVLTPNMPPGEQANTLMRCETKAKRRATLSILGLSLMDESEMADIPLFQQQLSQAKSSNEPRRLSAPPQAAPQPSQNIFQAAQEAAGEEIAEAVVAQFCQEAVAVPRAIVRQAVPSANPAPQATAAPAAHVMKRRLPQAPPVEVK